MRNLRGAFRVSSSDWLNRRSLRSKKRVVNLRKSNSPQKRSLTTPSRRVMMWIGAKRLTKSLNRLQNCKTRLPWPRLISSSGLNQSLPSPFSYPLKITLPCKPAHLLVTIYSAINLRPACSLQSLVFSRMLQMDQVVLEDHRLLEAFKAPLISSKTIQITRNLGHLLDLGSHNHLVQLLCRTSRCQHSQIGWQLSPIKRQRCLKTSRR